MHKTPAHDHPKRLPLANWKNTFGKLTVVKLPANTTSFKCVQTVLSLVQLLFVLWQLLLHALLFSSQPQMLAASCLSALLVSFRCRGIEGFIHLTALIHSMKPAVWRLVLLKHQDYHPLVIYIPIFGLPSALGYSATQLLSTIVENACAANKNTCVLLSIMWLEASCQPTWCCMITENISAAAKRHLHFLFGMLAVLILRRSRLLRFNSLQQSKQTPSQQMHKTPAHDHPKRLPLANWKNTFGKLTVVKLPANTTSFKCVQTVLSLVQLLFVLWQLLLHALLFSSQPQMLAASCLSALLVSFRCRGIEGFIHLTALIHSMKPAVWRLVLLKHQDYHPLVIYIPIFGLPSALGYSATQLLSTIVENACAANKNTCVLLSIMWLEASCTPILL